MKNFLKKLVESAGWARIIIGLFLLLLFIIAPFVQVRLDTSIQDVLVRVGMNGVLVLAMVPMIRSGCGLNFGLPVGIIAGLLGALVAVEMNLTGLTAIFTAILISLPIAVLLGFSYAQIINRVKGSEMMIATYIGFSSVALMCIGWMILPFSHPTMVWGFTGQGLRTTISVADAFQDVISNILSFQIGDFFYFPTGMLIFFGLACYFVHLFFKSKTGIAMTAVGKNPSFARSSSVNIDRMRTLSVIFSTALGAIGIIIYQQSFGFIQLYMGPFFMAFPAIAAVLLGGASLKNATITHVIVGTFLFQGVITMAPSVINSMMQSDLSEIIRIILSNGMIIYALTRKEVYKR
ncbi:MAG: ABC transporter permease [Thermovirgaceae bacterium]